MKKKYLLTLGFSSIIAVPIISASCVSQAKDITVKSIDFSNVTKTSATISVEAEGLESTVSQLTIVLETKEKDHEPHIRLNRVGTSNKFEATYDTLKENKTYEIHSVWIHSSLFIKLTNELKSKTLETTNLVKPSVKSIDFSNVTKTSATISVEAEGLESSISNLTIIINTKEKDHEPHIRLNRVGTSNKFEATYDTLKENKTYEIHSVWIRTGLEIPLTSTLKVKTFETKEVRKLMQLDKEVQGFPFFKVESSSIDQNQVFKLQEIEKSPALKWQKIKDAASYAIVMIDIEAYDASGRPFIHWVAFTKDNANWIPADAGKPNSDKLIQFENSLSKREYAKPAPPDKDHNYQFQIIPLKKVITQDDFTNNSSPTLADAEALIGANIIPNGKGGFGRLTATAPKINNNSYQSNDYNNVTSLSGKFYKDEVELVKGVKLLVKNINSDAIEITSNEKGPKRLPKEFLSTIDSNKNLVASNSDKELSVEFNKVKEAKSYVVLINNSQEVPTDKSPLVNFGAYGIAQPNKEKVTVKIPFKNTEILNLDYKLIQNSFQHIALKERVMQQSVKDGFVAIAPKQGNNDKGFYTIFVYATDLEPSAYNDLTAQNQKATVTKVLAKIRGHVLAESSVYKFKVEK